MDPRKRFFHDKRSWEKRDLYYRCGSISSMSKADPVAGFFQQAFAIATL